MILCHRCEKEVKNFNHRTLKHYTNTGKAYHVACIDKNTGWESLEFIIRHVVEMYDYTEIEAFQKNRSRKFVKVRMMLFSLLHELGFQPFDLQRYGQTRGYAGWDHANIRYHANNLNQFCEMYETWRKDREEIRAAIFPKIEKKYPELIKKLALPK